jgi:Response regulators consisting of a CheY-like receiver domain and a winged-helix DNA-binding domain
MNILLAEDDSSLLFMLKDGLQDEGFQVFSITEMPGLDGVLNGVTPDIAVLDVDLGSGSDGFQIARKLRIRYPSLPVIFASARTCDADLTTGFKFGNVDYVKKPYSIPELLLHIHELMSRQLPSKKIFQLGRYNFLPDELLLVHQQEQIKLKKQESELLCLLSVHINRAIKKELLIETLWGKDVSLKEKDNSINNLLNSLRGKLSKDETITILTIPKTGYKLSIE